MPRIEKNVVVALGWNLLTLVIARGTSVVSTLVLAWFLAPDEFASIAMISVIIQVSHFLTDAGFSEALIRKKEITQDELSSVFYTNIFLGLLLYLIIFGIAPGVAIFYEQESLEQLIKFTGLSIFFQGLSTVPKTILTKKLKFKDQLYITIPAVSISAILAVVLAYYEYGAWALAAQILCNSVLSALLYWCFTDWKLTFTYSFKAIKSLFRFSSYIILARVIHIPFQNMYLIVLPKFFSTTLVGLYFFAERIKETLINLLVQAVVTVTYPELAKDQNNNKKLKAHYRKIVLLTTFITFPLLVIIASLCPLLFEVFFPDKWFKASDYLMLMCFASILYPLHSINVNILKVKGRSDLLFFIGLIKKLVTLSIFIFTIQYDIEVVIYGQIVSGLPPSSCPPMPPSPRTGSRRSRHRPTGA